MIELKEKYLALLFKAEALLWDAAPESRKGMAYDFASAYGHAWPRVVCEIDCGAYLPLAEIKRLTLESATPMLPIGIDHPFCEFQNGLPGYAHITGTGRIEVFIPFIENGALRLTISRPNGAKLKTWWDDDARLIRYEEEGAGPWHLRHVQAWEEAVRALFFNIAEMPAFPAPYSLSSEEEAYQRLCHADKDSCIPDLLKGWRHVIMHCPVCGGKWRSVASWLSLDAFYFNIDEGIHIQWDKPLCDGCGGSISYEMEGENV